MIRKMAIAAVVVVGATALFASPALAHQCVNVNKPAGAGAQVVVGPDDELVSATNGLINRVERGIIDPETGEGFHGIIGFDEDGDGAADGSTYIVGPGSEIPLVAQESGSPDHGIVNICAVIEC